MGNNYPATDIMFPELKESEDERIRKAIIEYFENCNIKHSDWIAWLEKQGKQKPSYKDEPKFKVGDILVSEEEDRRHIYKVDAITNYGTYLLLDLEDGYTRNESVYICDLAMYLWSIEDAKDGDVLVVEAIKEYYQYPFVAIYKERGLDFFNSYCFISFDGKFYGANTGHSIEKIHPATKKQRDLLFQKMKEAGYEWDADKKELSKIQ